MFRVGKARRRPCRRCHCGGHHEPGDHTTINSDQRTTINTSDQRSWTYQLYETACFFVLAQPKPKSVGAARLHTRKEVCEALTFHAKCVVLFCQGTRNAPCIFEVFAAEERTLCEGMHAARSFRFLDDDDLASSPAPEGIDPAGTPSTNLSSKVASVSARCFSDSNAIVGLSTG